VATSLSFWVSEIWDGGEEVFLCEWSTEWGEEVFLCQWSMGWGERKCSCVSKSLLEATCADKNAWLQLPGSLGSLGL